MALVNYATREISAKVVYYGPGLSGKTTNIQHVFSKVRPGNKGKLISLSTQGDRTIFFDFLPVELGDVKGFKTRFHLYTVPGQVFYNSTRKLVLKGADGIVFVADSQKMMMDENIQSLDNLRANLAEMGVRPDKFPVIMQYNKRDLPNAATVAEMEACLNSAGFPHFEATALTGEGVLPTLTAIVKYIMHDLKKDPGSHNIDFESLMEQEEPTFTSIELVSEAVPGPEAPVVEAGPAPAPEAAGEDELELETAGEPSPGPLPGTAPAARQTFVLPLRITTGEGDRELALSVSVDVELMGAGAGSVIRVEALQPRPKEPPSTAAPEAPPVEAKARPPEPARPGLVAGPKEQEKKKTMIQKILGMK